jgi:hypothetical protein
MLDHQLSKVLTVEQRYPEPPHRLDFPSVPTTLSACYSWSTRWFARSTAMSRRGTLAARNGFGVGEQKNLCILMELATYLTEQRDLCT